MRLKLSVDVSLVHGTSEKPFGLCTGDKKNVYLVKPLDHSIGNSSDKCKVPSQDHMCSLQFCIYDYFSSHT